MTTHLRSHAAWYSVRIEWSNEDQLYIATVPELPGCRTHGATREEAVQRGQEAIESWLESAAEFGVTIPPPRVYDIEDDWPLATTAISVDRSQHQAALRPAELPPPVVRERWDGIPQPS